MTQQSTELDQLKSQKEHDLSLSVQNEELKRKIASLEAAVHQFDGANQKVIVLEKEKQSLMLLVEEITEKMQHSDSQWLVKLQNSQLKMEELLQQHKNGKSTCLTL